MATAYGATAGASAASASWSAARVFHHARPLREHARVAELLRRHVAVPGRERLPLEREQPVPLQVAEGAVVAEHVEAIGGALEGAPRLVAPVLPPADVGLQHPAPLLRAELARHRQELVVRQAGGRVEGGRDHLHLAVRIPVGERDLGPGLGLDALQHAGRDRRGGLGVLGEIARPDAAPLRPLEALQEGGDDLAQLDEHEIGVVADFPQRVRAHAEQERFVALAGAEDAHVRPGGGGQEPAQAVERLGPDRHAVGRVAVGRRAWGSAASSTRASARSSARRSRTRDRASRRSARAAGGPRAPRARDTSIARPAGRCRARSAWTARGRP